LNKIALLSDDVISKIAAGEIISRPLNIVKELIENSIDAGARKIIITADKNKITVEDDGCGIGKDYISLAFMRHSTSKIRDLEDLENIASLGFRGEALYAISVVSEVDLYTKTDFDITGTHFKIKGAKQILKEDITKKTGTKIVVSDLFYNLPARKKHLKNFEYELRQIIALTEQMAVLNCDISYTLKTGAKTRLYTSGSSNLKDTIYEVYGKEFASKLIEFNYEQSPLCVTGYISDLSAQSSAVRLICVNKRIVSSKTIHSAVKSAYEELIGYQKGSGDYVLNITLPYNMVDVNIHPSKEEVRFANETLIFLLIKNAVKEALSSLKINPVLNKVFLQLDKNENSYDNTYQEKFDYITEKELASFDASAYDTEHKSQEAEYSAQKIMQFQYSEKVADEEYENNYYSGYAADNKGIDKEELKLLVGAKAAGHIFNRYIILQNQDNIYLIDQHAAHERIIYEQLINDFTKNNVNRQMLLKAEEMPLSASESLLVKENYDLLHQLGYEMTFTDAGIKIHSVPIIASKAQNTAMLSNIINYIKKEPAENIKNRNDRIIKQACSQAVKSDRTLSEFEISRLITDLINTAAPFICPHGRDVIVKLKKSFIDSLFGR